MMSDNSFYGHGDILRAYCGVKHPRTIAGRVQHGWMRGAGFVARYMEAPYPKFVWSERNVSAARERGYRNVVPIGAPFLYLPHAPDPGPAAGPRSLLAFAFHGNELGALAGDCDRYAASLEELARDGFGPITVCLYWLEHRNPAVRAIFERRGFSVTTNGPRDDNPEFLERFRTLARRNAYVTSNRMATAAFYALALDRKFFLHGPPMSLVGHVDPDGGHFDAWQRTEFPSLAYERFGDLCHIEIAARELGRAFVRPPSELKELLGLRRRDAGRRTLVRAQLLAVTALRRAQIWRDPYDGLAG